MTTSNTTGLRETLEPCPFCGGTHAFVQNAGWQANTFMRCPDCRITMGLDNGTVRSHEQTVAAWNRRPSPNGSGEQGLIEEALFLIERLQDFERGLEDEDASREYGGHVAPSVARLEGLLAAAPAPALPEAKPVASPAEGEAWQGAIDELRNWMAVWDRVCDAADPDESDPPPWTEARKAMAPDYDPETFLTADYFSEYMRETLIYLVIDLLHAVPSSPDREAATREAVIEECAKIVENMPLQIYRDAGIGPAGRSCKEATFYDAATAIRALAQQAKPQQAKP